jgi:hypothetical protein
MCVCTVECGGDDSSVMLDAGLAVENALQRE